MKKFLYPFLAFFLVLFLLLVFNEQIENKPGKVLSSTATPINQDKILSPKELNNQYEEGAKSIILILNALIKPVSNQDDLERRLDSVIEVKETILSLKVPAQYQNLHLSLMTAADQLEKKFLEKQYSIANQDVKEKNYQFNFIEIQEKINNLTNEYSWL